MARQFAGDRQGHADHAVLRRRVGGLADLPVERRHRGGVDDHAALAAFVRLVAAHGLGGQAQHVEGADQVDVDDAGEALQAVHALAAEDLLRRADACAVDQSVHRAEGVQRGLHGFVAVRFAGHVGAHETRLRLTQLGRQGRADFAVDVGDHHLAARLHQDSRGGRAEPRTAAGDDEYLVVDTHCCSLPNVLVGRAQCAAAFCCLAISWLRRRKRWILPLGVFGSSSTNSISRG
ncbi:hypothetical protein D9M68_696270 [compost metagenome]